jgi:type I restriction enzyme S subunit
MGEVALVPAQPAVCLGQRTVLLRPTASDVEPKYLLYRIMAPQTQGWIRANALGSTVLHINVADVRRMPVGPLPSLNEQRRIVDILEDHLSRLDAAERELSSVTGRLDHIGEAALRSLVADDVDERPLADVLELPLSNGRSVPTRLNGFPVLRLTALKDEGVDLRERKGGDWTEVDAQRFLIRRGDYLIARGNGSLHRVGRGSLVRDEPDPVAYPDTAIRARPVPSVMTPEFLDVVWNSSRTRGQIEGMARTTAGIYKVNQKQLDSVQLPVPSLDVQDAVIRRMAEVDQQAQRAREAVAAARHRSSVLRSSLLAVAFEGRLTDRNSDRDMAEEYVSV